MKWTIDQPTTAGWFWHWNEQTEPTIVEVITIGRELLVQEFNGDGGAEEVPLYDGQWARPLKPPAVSWPHKGNAFDRVRRCGVMCTKLYLRE